MLKYDAKSALNRLRGSDPDVQELGKLVLKLAEEIDRQQLDIQRLKKAAKS